MVLTLSEKKFLELNKTQIVLISLYQLGGAKKKIHSEEIAFKAYRIKIDDFSWNMKKFRKYPDLEPTRKALFKLRGEKKVNGAYAQDLNKDGWILTESGLDDCLKKYNDFLDIKKNKSKPQQTDKANIISIKRSNYFKTYSKNGMAEAFDIYHVADFLKVRADNIANLREKFFQTKTVSKLVDSKVYDFLNYVEQNNSEILDQSKLVSEVKIKNKSKKNKLL